MLLQSELFMARQRLQAERQLRAKEMHRFRTEIDKMRRVETALKLRVSAFWLAAKARTQTPTHTPTYMKFIYTLNVHMFS